MLENREEFVDRANIGEAGLSAAQASNQVVTEAPLVSLAMPVYNGADFIEEAIQSILDQTFTDFELIITDNASTDATADICEAFAEKDARVQYHRNAENLGAAGNYNRGYELSRGTYLKWCAHDDNLSPDYIEKAVAALNANPEASMAFGRTQMIDTSGNEIDGNSFGGDPVGNLAVGEKNEVTRLMKSIRVHLSCGAIFGLFRRDMVAQSLLHRKYYQSDRPLLSELAYLGEFIYMPDAVFYNREHPTRSMANDDKASRAKWQNSKASSRFVLEHLPLAKQNFEIIFRHRNKVGLHRSLPPMLGWFFAPKQIRRHTLEVVSLISPNLASGMRRAGRTVWSKLRGKKLA